jgi:Family of unknown function (DUF6498)
LSQSYEDWLLRLQTLARSNRAALALLIVANLIPLIGVLFLGWDVATVLILYWLENGVVGLMTIPRILFARGPSALKSAISIGFGTNVLQAIFFVFNYGFFWVIHGFFVFVLSSVVTRVGMPDPIREVAAEPGLVIAVVALLLSHGANLVVNYFGRGEYRTAIASRQVSEPYPRMIILHMTIIFGALAVAALGQPAALVGVLVVGKTMLELSLFARQRGAVSALQVQTASR